MVMKRHFYYKTGNNKFFGTEMKVNSTTAVFEIATLPAVGEITQLISSDNNNENLNCSVL